MATKIVDVTEQKRLNEAREAGIPWKKWGPYLSERQWGTVREDYSDDGNAWDYFTHDQARSRAYRWGEDGLGGLCDDKQRLCFALALWNERDPILKERLFGLAHHEAFGARKDRIDHPPDRDHQWVLRGKLSFEAAHDLFNHSSIDCRQQAVLKFVDEELNEHQDHR